MNYPRYWHDCGSAIADTVFHVSRLRTSDDHILNVYESGIEGAEEAILIVNPIAASFLLTERLGRSLSRAFRVLSWDTRGAPYLDEQCDSLSVSVDRHARDLAEVLAFATRSPAHCICWCGGAPIMSWAMTNLNISFRSVSFIAPSGIGNCCAKHQTQYQSVFIPLLKRAARADASTAQAVYKLIFEEIAGHQLEEAANPVERDLNRIKSLCNKDLSSIKRLARLANELFIVPGSQSELSDAKLASMFDEVCARTSVLLLHCRDDVIVDYHSSLAASERNLQTTLILYPHGDHFLPFVEPDLICRDIENFIRLGKASSVRSQAAAGVAETCGARICGTNH